MSRLEDILLVYKRFFLRYPYILGMISAVYAILVVTWVFRPQVDEFLRARHQAAELRTRVVELEAQRRQQEQVLSSLTSRTAQAEFLKPIKFEERWRDERARETVGRLVEYAEFAISKGDFEHAERFYTEANEVQPTVTVPYYQGRLAYRRGDFPRAESKWLEARNRDTGHQYPDLSLYLGILYYQMGRLDEAKKYLRDFDSSGVGR